MKEERDRVIRRGIERTRRKEGKMGVRAESARQGPEDAVALQRKKSLLHRSWRRIAASQSRCRCVPAGCSGGTASSEDGVTAVSRRK
eukprot:3228007-Rhodomonas_salina.1